MANIVTSFVTELLPAWMERKARRGAAIALAEASSPVSSAPADRPEQNRPAASPLQRVHRPKSPPSDWRASSM